MPAARSVVPADQAPPQPLQQRQQPVPAPRQQQPWLQSWQLQVVHHPFLPLWYNNPLAWQSPRHFAPGDAELDLLASVLAHGKASRLYKALVYDQKIAQNVSARQAHLCCSVSALPASTSSSRSAAS